MRWGAGMGAAKKTSQERVLERLRDRGYGHDPMTGQTTGLRCEVEGCGSQDLQLADDASRITCAACGERYADPLEFLFRQPILKRGPAQAMSDAQRSHAGRDGETGGLEPASAAVQPDDAAAKSADGTSIDPVFHTSQPGVECPADTNLDGNRAQTQGAVTPAQSHLGEKIIIACLALVFLGVGLLAAAMSGFANFQAFAGMVDDPFQSQIWGWTGIIACVCSFGGFTFAYWHGVARRFWEAGRAMLIALAGGATSLVGTQLYMQGEVQERAAAAQAAQARAGLLELQIEDWRGQLAGLPADIRSVEGLEAYIAEVERVGRTNERPYRMALDELGQARRRADLETRIEAARGELAEFRVASLGESQLDGADGMRHWFIAAMLEVFSSQGTSIGFVALMVLAGRRGATHPAP